MPLKLQNTPKISMVCKNTLFIILEYMRIYIMLVGIYYYLERDNDKVLKHTSYFKFCYFEIGGTPHSFEIE